MKVKKLKYKDLYNGIRVIDEDGVHGYILDCSDIHNVHWIGDLPNDFHPEDSKIAVTFEDGTKIDGGASGLYCMDPECDEYTNPEDYYFIKE